MQIAYVNIFVSDVKAAVAFYQDVLGLPLEMSSPEHGYASFRVGEVRFGLAAAGEEQAELIGRHTGVGLAVQDLAAEHERLAGADVVFLMPPTRQPWGGFMAMFSDPEGNVFYLDQIAEMHG